METFETIASNRWTCSNLLPIADAGILSLGIERVLRIVLVGVVLLQVGRDELRALIIEVRFDAVLRHSLQVSEVYLRHVSTCNVQASLLGVGCVDGLAV
jgi:hypothetical protein